MNHIYLLVFVLLMLFSCNNQPIEEEAKEEVAVIEEEQPDSSEEGESYELKRVKEDSCFCIPKTIEHSYTFGDASEHWSRTIELPIVGKLVEESHYVTYNDKFPDGRLFANTQDENIETHLKISLEIYQDFDPDATELDLYGNHWQREWTPAERGQIGQGSIGDIQAKELSPAMELWLINMMWADGPPRVGTKFLLQANGKAVIVVAGYETGPGSEDFMGGVTPEVHHWLGTDSDSDIKISYLENQNFPYGPVKCLVRDTTKE